MRSKISFFLILLFITSALNAQPQFQEKRIYLLDVTGSMEGKGKVKTENIFDMVKENLSTAISHIEDPNTEIVVVPFTNTVFEPISGHASEKELLISQVRSIGIQKGDTNIADAWSYGVSHIDTTKINYMFLLTDGIHNYGPNKQVLYDMLNDWISYSSGKFMYAFYVMLVENAWDAAIREIADYEDHDNLQSIIGMDIDAALIRTSLKHKKNLYDSNVANLSFVNNNRRVKIADIGIDIEMEENPYYTIEKVRKALLDDRYSFRIIEKVNKIDIPYEVSTNIYISHNREQYPYVFMTPSKITMDIYNHGPSILSISDKKFDGRFRSLDYGKVKFKEPFRGPFKKFRRIYEPTLNVVPFKWCIKKDTATLYKELYVSFNDEAVRSEGQIYLYPPTVSEEDECFLDITSGEVQDTDDGFIYPFSIKVIPGSQSKTFKGDLLVYTTGIDRINKEEVNNEIQEYGTWSVKYKQKWTPILWLLWIIVTLLILALIIAAVGGVLYLIWRILPFAGKITPNNVNVRGNIQKGIAKNISSPSIHAGSADTEAPKKDDQEEIKKLEARIEDKSISTTERVECLQKLSSKLDEIKKTDPEKNQELYDSLNPNTQAALDEYNEKMWGPSPTDGQGGNWNGDTYELSKNNKHYSGCKKYGMEACKYDKYGHPDFSDVTAKDSVVSISDLYDKYTSQQLKARGGGGNIQDVAQERMAEKLSGMLKEWWAENHPGEQFNLMDAFYKWRDANDLVPHEDGNCKTIRLVPRVVHKAFTHRGGISNAILIKKYFG